MYFKILFYLLTLFYLFRYICAYYSHLFFKAIKTEFCRLIRTNCYCVHIMDICNYLVFYFINISIYFNIYEINIILENVNVIL